MLLLAQSKSYDQIKHHLKWHTRFSNETICKLLLWKIYKHFDRLNKIISTDRFQ